MKGNLRRRRTEVRVLYSRNEIYFGIACHDSVPNGPAATQLRRDVTQELDDYFEIIIDPRRDRRNAYVFQINPLGTQRDALITDERRGRPRMETRAGTEYGRRRPRLRRKGGRRRSRFRLRP